VPELPEVETIRRQLGPRLAGRTVVDATAYPHEKFLPALDTVGDTIVDLERRGKFLIAGLSRREREPADRELVVHLGMTGQLLLDDRADVDPNAGSGSDRHQRASWSLDDGSVVRFRDVRRFGRIVVADAGDRSWSATLSQMGPEPFDPTFDAAFLRDRVRQSTRAIKTQLLSQRIVAGVGNIYADEALWAAGIHPRATRLSRPAADRLVDALQSVLRAGIDAGGTTLRDYRTADGGSGEFQHELRCYGRAGEPCERCGGQLRRIVIDARSTTFCSTCQRR
jgi:formamidopyrimidine-DNA glycosylase